MPIGYHVVGHDQTVTVDNNATCLDSPYGGETVDFHNIPLTDVTLSVDSQIDGGTASVVTCNGVDDEHGRERRRDGVDPRSGADCRR